MADKNAYLPMVLLFSWLVQNSLRRHQMYEIRILLGYTTVGKPPCSFSITLQWLILKLNALGNPSQSVNLLSTSLTRGSRNKVL
jgi:hypothetical protein